MYVAHLSLSDFRSYPSLELPLEPGAAAFVGPNGQGKTNLVEAIGYAATLSSHRVATDVPLIRLGADRAVVRVAVARAGRRTLVELELNAGATPNRARLGGAPVSRPREVLGTLRTVTFGPEDLALVRGDPAERRRYLDDLLVARAPRLAAVRADYDRVLRQRSALLKSAGAARRGGGDLGTLDAWDTHLARHGAVLLAARLDLVESLRPLVDKAYDAVALGGGPTTLDYRSSLGEANSPVPLTPDRDALEAALLAELARRRPAELDRGVTLVGPHRDDLALSIGQLPARGYASHGESWSLAVALRLAAYELLRGDGGPGGDPVLILDDVFAELDIDRRERLATLVSSAEQVLITAAVAVDVPAQLRDVRYRVDAPGGLGRVSRAA